MRVCVRVYKRKSVFAFPLPQFPPLFSLIHLFHLPLFFLSSFLPPPLCSSLSPFCFSVFENKAPAATPLLCNAVSRKTPLATICRVTAPFKLQIQTASQHCKDITDSMKAGVVHNYVMCNICVCYMSDWRRRSTHVRCISKLVLAWWPHSQVPFGHNKLAAQRCLHQAQAHSL